MGQDSLKDQPPVFANACETASAEHTYSNMLKTHFVNRGSRAYIGSEVPAGFAARFTTSFFHFLYDRSQHNQPTAAGEALAQTRKFSGTSPQHRRPLLQLHQRRPAFRRARPGEVEAMHNPCRAMPQTVAVSVTPPHDPTAAAARFLQGDTSTRLALLRSPEHAAALRRFREAPLTPERSNGRPWHRRNTSLPRPIQNLVRSRCHGQCPR